MFRPSGDLNWALACSRPRQWHFFGSVNSELRSIETGKILSELRLLESHQLLRVSWPVGPEQSSGEEKTELNLHNFEQACGGTHILERELMAPIADFSTDATSTNSKSVILDITSMPKRFFFFYLKTLLKDNSVKDLIITYCAGKHRKGLLSGNSEDWQALPSFRGGTNEEERSAKKRLVVNVGFMPGGLEEHLKNDSSEQDLFLILPIAARVSSTRRVWKSAMEIQRGWNSKSPVHLRRVAPHDVSASFDLLSRISGGASLSLAPFGPKPISAAMCIYAALNNCPVYYAQPKWYYPDYTTSVVTGADSQPKISAHWIKHGGVCLYKT